MLGYFFKFKCRTCLLMLLLLTILIIRYCFKSYEQIKHPVLIWWTPFIPVNEKIISCGNYQCLLTKNRSYIESKYLEAVLFYGSAFKPHDIPLPKRVPWAIYHEESPKNFALFLSRGGQKLFDIYSTFSRTSHFPLTLQYLDDLNFLTDLKYYVSVKEKNVLLKNRSPILYLQSSCDTPFERDLYVSELMKYVNVDSYGACLNNKKLPEKLQDRTKLDVYDENLMHFMAKYKFIVAIENAVCEDYITEKLWRALAVGSVPIYLGSPSIKDWLPFNNSAIIVQEFSNARELGQYIKMLNDNDNLYVTYLQHKLNKNVAWNKLLVNTLKNRTYGANKHFEHSIPAFECHICETVHKKTVTRASNIYECSEPKNTWKNHWVYGRCEIKTLNYFINVLRLTNFTQEHFNRYALKLFENDECQI